MGIVQQSLNIFRNFIVIICILFCGAFFNVNKASAGPVTPEELKAVMIVKFTAFITWPNFIPPKKDNKLVIGVIGDPEMLNQLKSLEGKIIDAKSRSVIEVATTNLPESINVLYLGSSQIDKWPIIRKNIKKYILTISESDEFIEQGGIISFYKKPTGHIGFAVNRSEQIKSGLIFSSSLLRLADIRNEENGAKQ